MKRPIPTRMPLYLAAQAALAGLLRAEAPSDGGWRRPPEPIATLVESAPSPGVTLSPCGRWLLLLQAEGMPGLEVMARPYRKLAGLRIDPRARVPQLGARITRIVIRPTTPGADWELPVEPGHWLFPQWSADGNRLAFVRATDEGSELWWADVEQRTAAPVPGVRLNGVLGPPFVWMPDQRGLLCKLALDGGEPADPPAPAGPVVQETAGLKAQVRTYQDLLQNEGDAARFEGHATAQLAIVDGNGVVRRIGDPDRFESARPSPDGTQVLTIRLERPYSYLVPWDYFPRRMERRDLEGRVVQTVAALPLQESVPIGGVPTGPRAMQWIPGEPATLAWFEALDGGDPKAVVPHRDVIRRQAEGGGAADWHRTEHRAESLAFAEGGDFALLTEFDRDTRRERWWKLDLAEAAEAPVKLLERSTQDAYGDPGRPVRRVDPRGWPLIRRDGTAIFLAGEGASPDGDRPFLDRWDLASGAKTRLFRGSEARLEAFVGFLDPPGRRLLVTSESASEPRNYFAQAVDGGPRQALTDFADPAAGALAGVTKELIRYAREDGVPLSGTLHLPPGWKPGRRLPVLVWAYPREFNQASDAGQVRGSPHRYARPSGASHLWLVLAGYAVLDEASMPIVGPARGANDTFVQQLAWNAEAAVAALVRHGVGERGRIAVAGHSYGAFMTANLLCHTDLFAAGIARSGAYNRTLTPFGFQNEDRTYWEAPELYHAMSPFANAQKLNEPILLIHGDDDNNAGTFPLQSQRLYGAVKGHGGTARLVMLPHESHGYAARESVQHCLHEMIAWLDRHLRKP